ncbi:cyclin-Q [Harpia harpyja]|uniref:cyclin-Q n=1 Tax=Harpia harpyja TaxID=202280 RepID=UPI0022B210CE|nr:cyclin-Q [Harpia harpyja]
MGGRPRSGSASLSPSRPIGADGSGGVCAERSRPRKCLGRTGAAAAAAATGADGTVPLPLPQAAMALEPAEARGARPGGAEARARFRIARFIMEAGVKLGLGSVALATACAAFHRFSRAVGPAAPHDPHLVAAAALFLAGKAQGTPLRARDVPQRGAQVPAPRAAPPGAGRGFWGLRDSLLQCELLLLRVLRFRVPVAHPHKYLLQYLLALGRWGRRGGLGAPAGAGVSWALVRDGAAGGLGLRHPPQHLAAAALHLALALCGRPGPPGDPPRWWQVLSPGLGPEELEEIVRELLGLYGLDTQVGGDPPRPPPPPRPACSRSFRNVFNDRRPRGGGKGGWGGGGSAHSVCPASCEPPPQ